MGNSTPAPSSTPAQAAESNSNPLTRQPIVMLLAILLLALGLRAWKITEPLQRDEFASLYAVAERTPATAGATVTAQDPLHAVAGLGEVSDRSVLPYGIRNPVPLYHDIVYFTIQALPIAEWSLRLPSLLAGLGCVLAVYFLCRRLIGVEMALVAALFVAVEPIQVATSVLACSYALANLACVLSFLALVGALSATKPANAIPAAVSYGVAVAFIGYMNPVLLLVVVAHLGLIIYWAVAHKGETAHAMYGAIGVVVAALLLVPVYGYIAKLGAFSTSHREYLQRFYPTQLMGFFIHNGTFLAGLLVALVAGYIVRQQMQGGEEAPEEPSAEGSPATEPARPTPSTAVATVPMPAAAAVAETVPVEPPPPDNPDAIWVGRLWIFLPQLVAIVLAYAAGETIFFTRYLSYTTIGGLIILAYWATREPSREVRLGVSGAIALALFLMGFVSWGRGHFLSTPSQAKLMASILDERDTCKPGDVILLRSSLVEGDFLPNEVAPESRKHIEGAIAAPFQTLYAPQKALPIIVLSKSHNSPWAKAWAGPLYDPKPLYSKELGDRLRAHTQQFWVANDEGGEFPEFLTALLPWLADQVGWDLKVARHREGDDRYFTVQTDAREGDFLEGLSNRQAKDFAAPLVRVQRLQPRLPREATNCGAFTLTPCSASVGALTASAWLAGQERTPRLASVPSDSAATPEKTKQ
jgi:hypothetical protein